MRKSKIDLAEAIFGARQLSRAGVACAILYLAFVAFSIARTEVCFRTDGLFCALGYFVPAVPWIFAFLMVGEILPDTGAFAWPLTVLALVMSVLINLVLPYRYGRLLGRSAKRRRS